MSFDYETQSIIFKQDKTPLDDRSRTLRFSLFDLQGNEKQNYEVKVRVDWTIEDDPIEEEDE